MLLSACLMGLGCSGPDSRSGVARAIAEVNARDVRFPDYPRPDMTYLSFSRAHGFQVNYLGRGGRAWLWYPGNLVGVPEEYKQETVSGREAICFRHPSTSYNPVTKTRGGGFACLPLEFQRKLIVAALAGDPFRLASGRVPYRLDRCMAPAEFTFDRKAIGC